MTSPQFSLGLSASFSAVALHGRPGAIALLLTLFMAVISSSSLELIAISSIMTFDVHKMYIKPHTSPEELVKISHILICVFGLVMTAFACIWNAIGIDLGWLLLVMGLLIGGVVFPAAFTVTWKGQSKWGASVGAIGGLASGLIGRLTMAKIYYGELTVATTGGSYPTLVGNIARVLTGLVLTAVISYIKLDNFDWEGTRSINLPDIAAAQKVESETDSPPSGPEEKKTAPDTESDHHATLPTALDEEKEVREDAAVLEDPTRLKGALRFAYISATILTLIMLFIPIPMFLSHYILA